jgi:DNA-binding response OmpR family regulator
MTSISRPHLSARALLIEGRATSADILRWNLERNGFAVELTANGEEALNRCAQFRPHVVLLNWRLLALSGT